jgi:hypothetical protein
MAMLFGGKSRSALQQGLETWTVDFGKRKHSKQLPEGATDAQVRVAFADEYRQARSEAGRAAVLRPTLKQPKQRSKYPNTATPTDGSSTQQGYGLHQQFDARNGYGRYDVDITPPRLEELRRRYPNLRRWEDWAWSKSQPQTERWWDWNFPFRHSRTRPAKEHGFVAFQSPRNGSIIYQPLYPQFNPKTGKWNQVHVPKHTEATGQFHKPGYVPVIIQHTHPERYGHGVTPGTTYGKGPSDKDFDLAYQNKGAISVIQAKAPDNSKQFFYFGPQVYKDRWK